MPPTPKKPADFSQSFHQRLNSYALAASAAGVGVLALAPPSEAKVIYTPMSVTIWSNGSYNLSLNHDGRADFTIYNNVRHFTSGKASSLFVSAAPTNEVEGAEGIGSHSFLAAALKSGARIPTGRFSYNARMAFQCSGSGCYPVSSTRKGHWFNVTNRYLGLKFKIHGQTHYGWARLSVSAEQYVYVAATLTGYAYETIPNKAIIAGKEKGADVITVQPASLGHLAAGAPAIPAWRSGK